MASPDVQNNINLEFLKNFDKSLQPKKYVLLLFRILELKSLGKLLCIPVLPVLPQYLFLHLICWFFFFFLIK